MKSRLLAVEEKVHVDTTNTSGNARPAPLVSCVVLRPEVEDTKPLVILNNLSNVNFIVAFFESAQAFAENQFSRPPPHIINISIWNGCCIVFHAQR